jgi:hypothetical protein
MRIAMVSINASTATLMTILVSVSAWGTDMTIAPSGTSV